MRKRGALFYIIDAFVAAGIITLTLTIVLTTKLNQPTTEAPTRELQEYLGYLETTRLKSVEQVQSIPTAEEVIRTGKASSQELTLLEALGELSTTHLTDAADLAEETAKLVLPPQYGANVSVHTASGTTTLYTRGMDRLSTARHHLASSRPFSFTKRATRERTWEPITSGNGNNACTPADCLFVTNTTDYDAYGCDQTLGGNWRARCESYNASEALSGTVEVRIWP